METSTLLIGGAIIVVGFIGIVYVTSQNNQPVVAQQPQAQGNAATEIAQGATQGLLGFFARSLSSSNDDTARTGNRDLGNGWIQGGNGWLYGPPARV